MKTRVTELLGISYPVIQGGMAHIAEYHLASAVSEAGGLGVIASANGSAERVKKEIEALRERTDRPFGVNIMLLSPHAAEVAQMAAEEKVPVITTGAGNPEKYMSLWKSAGIKVIPVVASVALAKRMERCGADAVIAEGCEAGGHIGELTSMTLIPQIADEVEIPVIGAGGVGDGRGLAAMLILGAEGVQVGTRFVVAEESIAHENYKQKILKARDIDSVVTGRSCGHPIRSVRNPHTRNIWHSAPCGAQWRKAIWRTAILWPARLQDLSIRSSRAGKSWRSWSRRLKHCWEEADHGRDKKNCISLSRTGSAESRNGAGFL